MSEHKEARTAEKDARAFEEKHPGCCPRCGWHMSSHMRSQYGLDCPWGVSPALKAGNLPPRDDHEDYREEWRP